MKKQTGLNLRNKIRIVTATSLFDGHDAAINIMRRIMQSYGAEVIHLGHNRSAEEIVDCAIQEDAQGIAITSYQGGHVEFFKYVYDLLQEKQAKTRIIGGGGGTILPEEVKILERYGITKIYTPDDGRAMGLKGMIEDALKRLDFDTLADVQFKEKLPTNITKQYIAQLITLAETDAKRFQSLNYYKPNLPIPVIGITGTGGAGKSSLVDELLQRFLTNNEQISIAVLSIDPSKRKSGGALLGDRIRMNSIDTPRIFMRSFATRQAHLALNKTVEDGIAICKAAAFDLIFVETSGIGQSDSEITDISDISMYVMTSEYGAATQLEKIDMLDYADIVALNKADKKGAEDALKAIKKQVRRNKEDWDTPDNEIPVFATKAAQFKDEGVDLLFNYLSKLIEDRYQIPFKPAKESKISAASKIIPDKHIRYLAAIAQLNRDYTKFVEDQSTTASRAYQLHGTLEMLKSQNPHYKEQISVLETTYEALWNSLDPDVKSIIEKWPSVKDKYKQDIFEYQVRDKLIQIPLYFETLSNTRLPKVALPKYREWADIVRWRLQENMPGRFPYTAGVFPLRRTTELPTRMFAGEGVAERTNKRFHLLARNAKANRLSTAFDSVTLYGEDPDERPDIFGKIGNSGVSVSTLDDMKVLYSGFDLCDPKTSVSMTINGPAPFFLAFFLNTAIDQQCEKYIREHGLETQIKEQINKLGREQKREYYGELPDHNDGLGLMLLGVSGDEVLDSQTYENIKAATLKDVRGTVQADILKEDQAQNTCIFSAEFALMLMGDIQQFFIDNQVRNFYSVSISGYHIAEAGANPITQLAFTLANGFTYIEYYLSRGMKIDDFAPSLSFFFSNGIDAEYAVIGRVARRIWAKALKHKYGANDRSQKLKYHIQTSGRSLHAQEISFNDIRTTLQALYAIYDSCNSLHTNAYDEAITTPTEESVRRAVAIQLIINKEYGLSANENMLQGSFIIEEITDLVEEAVLVEFERLSERGGVIGAMENMYQRSKIQEESMHYESLKLAGEIPVVGVNTFLNEEGSPTIIPSEVVRSHDDEKRRAIESLRDFKKNYVISSSELLKELTDCIHHNQNSFEVLMKATKRCTLGQLTHTLFDVGGRYRRNL